MAFTHVSARVRDVFSDIGAVRALESRLLAALEFLMITKATLVAEDAATARAGESLAQRLHARARPDHRRRRQRRRRRDRRWIRVKNITSRDGRYSRRVYTVAQA